MNNEDDITGILDFNDHRVNVSFKFTLDQTNLGESWLAFSLLDDIFERLFMQLPHSHFPRNISWKILQNTSIRKKKEAHENFMKKFQLKIRKKSSDMNA